MIFDDKEFNIKEVEAFYINRKNTKYTYIKVISENDNSITFTFNNDGFNPNKLEINEKTSLIKYIYWDVEYLTNDTFYLFDITKDTVDLTRIDDNLYKLNVHVENPDMIYSPLGENVTFKNLIIETTFSFKYEN